jgi:predicted kinase
MSKMIIMQGLPASGKSTRAQELLREMGNAVRINKDLLRTMLHFDKFNGRNEGLTRDAARSIARAFLTNGTNVIIDDTNLNPGTLQSWKDLAKELEAKVEVVRMETTALECVMRDNARANSVGGTVIKNMALQYGLIELPPGIVICDIDGTIADITHRLHFVKKPEGEKKDWHGFFEAMDQDSVRQDVQKMLVDYYNKGQTIIFMSGRPDTYKERTLAWLEKNHLTFAFTLIMRRADDKRDDTEVKKQMLDTYFPDKSKIHTVIDDRPSVIRMWKENGLNVLDVGKGEEF